MGRAMVKRSRGLERAELSMAAAPAVVDSRALLTGALDHLADMVLIVDAAGRHVFLNPATRDLALTDAIGVEVDPAVWGDWFDADDQPVPPEQWPLRVVLRGGTRVQREMWRRNRDGSIFWMQLSAASIRDADGQIIGAVATAKDITARKQAETET